MSDDKLTRWRSEGYQLFNAWAESMSPAVREWLLKSESARQQFIKGYILGRETMEEHDDCDS